ncbi:hypothetical protein VFA_003630 [Vibrio furnissii CIP 102972]|nr:hypothetical protein VFA_003630 [Vibrio furnissii CIP 102972]
MGNSLKIAIFSYLNFHLIVLTTSCRLFKHSSYYAFREKTQNILITIQLNIFDLHVFADILAHSCKPKGTLHGK